MIESEVVAIESEGRRDRGRERRAHDVRAGQTAGQASGDRRSRAARGRHAPRAEPRPGESGKVQDCADAHSESDAAADSESDDHAGHFDPGTAGAGDAVNAEYFQDLMIRPT